MNKTVSRDPRLALATARRELIAHRRRAISAREGQARDDADPGRSECSNLTAIKAGSTARFHLRTSSERTGTEAAETGKQVGHTHWLQDEAIAQRASRGRALFGESLDQ